jgi:hypothetical protein
MNTITTDAVPAEGARDPAGSMKPGIYPGLSMAEYLAMPALSASLLQTMLEECPAAAWFDSWLNPKPRVDEATPR